MQSAITLPMRAVTAPPVPAICRHCGASQRAQEPPLEADWRGVIAMLVPLLASCGAFVAAAVWLASTGVLAWLG